MHYMIFIISVSGYDCVNNSPCTGAIMTDANGHKKRRIFPHVDNTKYIRCCVRRGCVVRNCPHGARFHRRHRDVCIP